MVALEVSRRISTNREESAMEVSKLLFTIVSATSVLAVAACGDSVVEGCTEEAARPQYRRDVAQTGKQAWIDECVRVAKDLEKTMRGK